MKYSLRLLAIVLAACCADVRSSSASVGEHHLVTSDSTAALRDAAHRSLVRVTIWYPAVEGGAEERIDEGPSDRPLFRVGTVSPDAAFLDARPRPVILLSHGFGGTARMMGWFGLALARHGYVVVAVDHPGNNGADEMTVPGAILSWDRTQDLQAALDAARTDPIVGTHIDLERLGVAGFSAGGFTALISAGAKIDIRRFFDFCHQHPADGVCAPQKELSLSIAEAERALATPELAAEAAHAPDSHEIAGVRAVFAMAPAIIQALPPQELEKISLPVAIILGDKDPVVPPNTNGLVAAQAIPHAELKVLPGVGHYDFLSTCTPAGVAALPLCAIKTPQGRTHKAAIDMAQAFFDRVLGTP